MRSLRALTMLMVAVWTIAVLDGRVALAQISSPPRASREPVEVSANFSQDWEDAESGMHVWLLRGNCRISQGELNISARQIAVWVGRDPERPGQDRVFLHAEDDVRFVEGSKRAQAQMLNYGLITQGGTKFEVRHRLEGEAAPEDTLYKRGLTAFPKAETKKKNIIPTQFAAPGESDIGPELRSVQVEPAPTGVRRIRVFQRSAIPYNVFSFESTNTSPPEQVWILSGGINLLIDGVETVGTVDLSADRMVIWTQTASTDFSGETYQSRDTPLQVYLEGNIVARQGDNVLRASRAFYDAREDRAVLLDAELKVQVPELPVSLRIRAERLRQISRSSFHAQNAWLSTSTFGKPGYRLESSDVYLEERMNPGFFGPQQQRVDPETGIPEPETTPWVTTLNSRFLLEDLPVFFTPYLSAPAKDPNIPLRKITFEQDRIFGSQIYTTWNLFKLFGLQTPPGTQLDLLADFMSERGPGIGLSGSYKGSDLFGFQGDYRGSGLAYFIHDDGTDNLGRDRRSLEPASSSRGRVHFQHRQDIFPDLTILAELGYVSDRNFMEQYYESEWDTGKDQENLIYLKQQNDNWAWTAFGKAQTNDFDTTTEWLPKGDLYLLGEPLFGSWVTWSSHSSVGYGHLNPAVAPTDPADVYTPLPFVADAEGIVMMTRHELAAPFNLGPVKVVPYALGEAAYWSEDLNGNDTDRLYGSAGVRASVLFWKAMPNVHSSILGLRGLAHKMTFDLDYSYSAANEDLSNIAQYNEFDDISQYRFRNRFETNTFGGTIPPQFDPRSYAVRTGAAHNVTAPYHELVDDQQVLRFGWRHRLQTKVGPIGNQRTKDWMALDLEAAWFPQPEQDNFGEDFGLLSARYNWNVGERTTFVASALYDLFDDGQKNWNLGILNQRSERGSVYVGLRQLKGAELDSQILSASYSYVMSPKWISTVGTAYDLAENENRGQSLTITRVGRDFLLHVGANIDTSKDNVGFAISLEPRFFPFQSSGTQLGSLLNGS